VTFEAAAGKEVELELTAGNALDLARYAMSRKVSEKGR
jgi:hypothetical protein